MLDYQFNFIPRIWSFLMLNWLIMPFSWLMISCKPGIQEIIQHLSYPDRQTLETAYSIYFTYFQSLIKIKVTG